MDSLLVTSRLPRQIRLLAGLFDRFCQLGADALYVLDCRQKCLAKHEVRGTNTYAISELPIRLGIALIAKREPGGETLETLCFSGGNPPTSRTED